MLSKAAKVADTPAALQTEHTISNSSEWPSVLGELEGGKNSQAEDKPQGTVTKMSGTAEAIFPWIGWGLVTTKYSTEYDEYSVQKSSSRHGPYKRNVVKLAMKALSESSSFDCNGISSSKYLGITMEDNNANE